MTAIYDSLKAEIAQANAYTDGKVDVARLETLIEGHVAAETTSVVEVRMWLSSRLSDFLGDGNTHLDRINAFTAEVAPTLIEKVQRTGWEIQPYSWLSYGDPNDPPMADDGTDPGFFGDDDGQEDA